MTIRRAAFGLSWSQNHLRSLRPRVSQDDIEAFAESEVLVLHLGSPISMKISGSQELIVAIRVSDWSERSGTGKIRMYE